MAIAWAFWLGCMSVTAIIFWLLWRYAGKIERLEEEEKEWLDYLEYVWRYEPQNGEYYQRLFESKFLSR